MSFNRGTSFGSSTPLQPPAKPIYPSFNLQTPATPSPQTTTSSQPLQQKPPQRPASVPLSFGGGLSHSASTPSLSQAFQNQAPNPQGAPANQFSQPFSPAPQPPLTTYDLSGNSPFSKGPSLQWGQQIGGGAPLGGQGLTRSHSQQFMPQTLGNPLGERRYLPSHLRSYSPERSSPLAKESNARDPVPSPKEKRRVSFGSITTFGNPSTANFGGAGFGTPKDDGKSKSRREEEDLPPSASIYDNTRSSPFPKQDAQRSPSPPPDITPSLFSTAPLSSPPKRSDPTPVILFGFPPSHSLLIIREYERHGQILEHFSSTHPQISSSGPSPPQEIVQGGNWLRITYADPVSAARAVSTNGTIIGGAYMIGVIYAPKPESTTPAPATREGEMEVDSPPAQTRATAGERKMNVVRGGQSMFVKKEVKTSAAEQVGWGTWVWNNVVGSVVGSGGGNGQVGGGVVAGGGQSNVVVRALKGLSETVFGF